ncbi:MAG: hypothetical protein JNL40_11345 [Cyclobacteriaceae bacterium]|nr:hypothetical protein [Cyclobacteriaceae bacterium]
MAVTKKKVIKSLDNLSEDLRELLKKQYPLGYENSITRINNAKKEPIFVFPLEAEEATYLVKIPATRNSEGEYDVDSKPKDPEFAEDEKADDAEFGATDEFGGEDDYNDEEDSGGRTKDPSYEPDFDN